MNKLKSVFWGLLFMVGGFLFWRYWVGNPFNELALIRHGVTAKGFITDVREDVIDGDRRVEFVHSATYKFQLPNGQTVEAETGDQSGRLRNNISRNIEVEYLPDNPAVSRIKGDGSPTITDWLWRKVGIGGLLLVMFLSPGAYLIYREFYPKPKGSDL